MTYVSSNTIFLNTTQADGRNTTGNQIMQIQVVTNGIYPPIAITSLHLSTTGCTNAASDLLNAKVYFTGNSNVFSNTTQFGITVLNPNGAYVVQDSVTLSPGTNYFWVTYDITSNAGFFDTLKGCCTQITGTNSMGTQVPTTTCPSGYQYITPPMTYTSSTTLFMNNTQTVSLNSVQNNILQIQVVTSGSMLPIDITSIALSTTGCPNAITNIANAKVYFTGNSSVFTTTTQFGSAAISPNVAFTVIGSSTLSQGINYFWVTYDITGTAIFNDTLKGCCTSLTGSGTMGTQIPAVTCPTGFQTIINTPGNWFPVITSAPYPSGGVMLLLTDGRVICKTATGLDGYGNIWQILTPDIHGSYTNGTDRKSV